MSIYTIKSFTSGVTVEGYIAEFHDELHFLELCKRRTNYDRSQGYPPLDFDTESFLRQYKYAYLTATKIIPEDKDIPIEYTQKLILPEWTRIENELLDMERKYGGCLFAYIGECFHCSDNEYTRNCDTPCRHPEKVCPSLEALGFDIVKTLSEFFSIGLL